MSTAVTIQDLELEQAELLPSRETLWCYRPCCYPCYHSYCYSCYHQCYQYQACYQPYYSPCH